MPTKNLKEKNGEPEIFLLPLPRAHFEKRKSESSEGEWEERGEGSG